MKQGIGVSLRPATAADAEAVQAIYAPVVAGTPISFEVDPPTPEEMARRIEATGPAHPWLVAERGGVVSGFAYAGPHRGRAAYRWSVDVSVYVSPDQHRRGVGRALYCALFELLALQGYRQAFTGITLPNPASVGLHESLGFGRVGVYRRVGWKSGAWHDVGWWQLALDASPGEPAEPLSLDELDPDQVRAALGAHA